MAVFAFKLLRAVNKKRRPSGRKLGQRCEFSCRAVSRAVSGCGVPPRADTRINGALLVGLNTISPEGLQAAPRPCAVSQIFCGGPPAIAIFLSLPWAKK